MTSRATVPLILWSTSPWISLAQKSPIYQALFLNKITKTLFLDKVAPNFSLVFPPRKSCWIQTICYWLTIASIFWGEQMFVSTVSLSSQNLKNKPSYYSVLFTHTVYWHFFKTEYQLQQHSSFFSSFIFGGRPEMMSSFGGRGEINHKVTKSDRGRGGGVSQKVTIINKSD